MIPKFHFIHQNIKFIQVTLKCEHICGYANFTNINIERRTIETNIKHYIYMKCFFTETCIEEATEFNYINSKDCQRLHAGEVGKRDRASPQSGE